MSYRSGLLDKITSASGRNFLLGKGFPLLTMLVLYAVLGLMVGSMIDSSSSEIKIAVDKSFAYKAFYSEAGGEMINYGESRIENISAVVQEVRNNGKP